MSSKTITRTEIEETVSELYLLGILVITDAGTRLTYPVLVSFMRNPIKTLDRIEESSRDSNSSLARDIVESVCYLLVGSQERKWLSIEDIIKELEKKGYTITTIDNVNDLNLGNKSN